MSPRFIHVAAAAVEAADGRILVTRRPDHVHQGGLWEFPGGKLEPGEDLRGGLDRELFEEIGIRVQASAPLIRIYHDYGDRRVLLDVHKVSAYAGTPHGREGQPLRWLRPEQMRAEEFPAADRPIITALRLPDRMLITPDPADRERLLNGLAAALEQGIRVVQLRIKRPIENFPALVATCLELCRAHGASLVVNPLTDAVALPQGVGLHLNSRRLMALAARPAGVEGLVGASCHDAAQLRHAGDLGLDYALLSPVAKTASHPDAAPLGWTRFAELADQAALPVYALGGMGIDDVFTARSHGGQGIAAIRGLWPG